MKCTCDSCQRWNELIEHKHTFTAARLGLKGGRRAKRKYIAKLRGWRDRDCEQKEQPA